MTLREFAPAKINLTLGVRGRRRDGYHLLDSLVAFANIGDDLALEPADEFSLEIEGPFAQAFSAAERESGAESTNIVARAVYALAELVKCKPAGRLRLTKNLPLASGVGGGSADAAATLRLFCTAWGIEPVDVPLELLIRLGADVPVCFIRRTAWMTGIGGLIDPAPQIPAIAIVLVNPRVACSTAHVFARGVAMSPAMMPRPDQFADFAALIDFLRAHGNDMTEAALTVAPVIGKALEIMSEQKDCALARMAGSGASVFGLFTDTGAARNAATAIKRAKPDWWAQAGTLLSG